MKQRALRWIARNLLSRDMVEAVLETRVSDVYQNIPDKEKYLVIPTHLLSYKQDLLFTLHHAGFREDPRFMEAYRLGKETDGGLLLRNYDIDWRIHVLCWAASHAAHLEGDFADCGVSTGIFSRAIMHYTDFKTLGKTYWLLDTFAGLDPRYSSENEMQRNKKLGYSAQENVYENVKRTFEGWPVAIIKGAIPDTLTQVTASKFAFVSIDMNSVQPERAAIRFFWDRLVSGGIIVLDDYAYPGCEAQRHAHDEFAASRGVKILNLPTCQGLLIKP